MTALASKPRRIINRPLVELIELVRVVENTIYFVCPSRSYPGCKYTVMIGDAESCTCFRFGHLRRKCAHIEAAEEYIQASKTIEEMYAEDDGLISAPPDNVPPDWDRHVEEMAALELESIIACPVAGCDRACDWIAGEGSDYLWCQACGDVTKDYLSEGI